MAILLSLMIFDLINRGKDVGLSNSKIMDATSIITALLPAIITIISISTQLGGNKIYGATYSEIKDLYGAFYFSFLHMVVVIIVSFGFVTCFQLCNFEASIIGLSAICLVYSFIFATQEIAILSHSKWFLSKLLRKRFQTERRNSSLFEGQTSEFFQTMMTRILLVEGAKSAVDVLTKKRIRARKNNENNDDRKEKRFVKSSDKNDEKVKNETNSEDERKEERFEIDSYLLLIQNQYFAHCKNNLSNQNWFINLCGDDFDLPNAIDMGYQNIVFFLQNETASHKVLLQIRKALFVLHDLCVAMNLKEKEKLCLSELISSCLWAIGTTETITKVRRFCLEIILIMSSFTLNRGQTWFIESLRDNNQYPSYIFEFKNCSLGILITTLICRLLSKQEMLGPKEIDQVKEFIREKVGGTNADGSTWSSLVREAIEFSNPKDVVLSLGTLLFYFETIPERMIMFGANREVRSYPSDWDFGLEELFDYWLEFVFLSLSYSQLNDDWQNFDCCIFKYLTDGERAMLAKTLSSRWLNNGHLREDIPSTISKWLFGEEETFYEEPNNESFIRCLNEFHDDFYRKKSASTSNSKNEVNFQELASHVQKCFISTYSSFPLYDSNAKTSVKQCFVYALYTLNPKPQIDALMNNLSNQLLFMVNKKIGDEVERTPTDSYSLNDESAKELLEKGFDRTSSFYRIQAYCDKFPLDLATHLRNTFKGVGGLPRNLYWKDGAIKLGVTLLQDNPITVREPSSTEIDAFIEQRGYKPYENGLYRFSESGDPSQAFYVTREELSLKIKERLKYIFIPFAYSVVLKKEDIVFFEKRKSETEPDFSSEMP